MTETASDPAGWTESLGEHATNPAAPRVGGFTIEALSRTWPVAPFENRLKAQFEQWVRSNALRDIREMEALLRPDERQEMMDAFVGGLAAGHYKWDGKHCRSARQDMPGIHYEVFLILRRCDPKMTEELAGQICRDNTPGASLALKWALGNSSSPAKESDGGTEPTTMES